MFNSKKATKGVYSVVDTSSVLAGAVFTIILFVIGAICMTHTHEVWGFFLILFGIFMFFVNNARKSGVIIDTNNNTLTFPAYGLAANGFLDVISPKYWLKRGFGRMSVPLDDLNQLSSDSTTEKKWDKTSESWTYTYSYFVRFSGTFGNAYLRYGDMNNGQSGQQKCMELLGLLRQVTNMGIPVVNI